MSLHADNERRSPVPMAGSEMEECECLIHSWSTFLTVLWILPASVCPTTWMMFLHWRFPGCVMMIPSLGCVPNKILFIETFLISYSKTMIKICDIWKNTNFKTSIIGNWALVIRTAPEHNRPWQVEFGQMLTTRELKTLVKRWNWYLKFVCQNCLVRSVCFTHLKSATCDCWLGPVSTPPIGHVPWLLGQRDILLPNWLRAHGYYPIAHLDPLHLATIWHCQ